MLFVQNPSEYRLLDSYLGYITEVSYRVVLFVFFFVSLCFFDYFVKNWDALCELYLDFYWIDTLNIVIIHENLSKLSFDDFRMYMSIVLYCIDSWKKDIGHNILFVFNQKERKQIMDIIHDCLQADDFKYNLKETAL